MYVKRLFADLYRFICSESNLIEIEKKNSLRYSARASVGL